MKIKHALYFAFAFIGIAVLLVGDGSDGPLARMQGSSSSNEQTVAPSGERDAEQLASSDGEGFADDFAISEFDVEPVEDVGFEYYGDEDLFAQSGDDEPEAPARPSRKATPNYIIPRDNPSVVLQHSGPRVNREQGSTVERNAAEF